MSPEMERFKQTLRQHAEQKTNAIALWGDHLQLDYATLYTEVIHRQQRLRDKRVRVVALALDNGVEAMLWDLAALFEGLTCVALPPFSVRRNASTAWSKARPNTSLPNRNCMTSCKRLVIRSAASSGTAPSLARTGCRRAPPS